MSLLRFASTYDCLFVLLLFSLQPSPGSASTLFHKENCSDEVGGVVVQCTAVM